MLYKLKSIELCSNTIGQICFSLMVDPPTVGRESDECVELYTKEKDKILNGLKRRAQILTNAFKNMRNISCKEVEGSVYAFP